MRAFAARARRLFHLLPSPVRLAAVGSHRAELLETRVLLAVVEWDGEISADWAERRNWLGDQLPAANDDVVLTASNSTVELTSGNVTVRSITAAGNLRLTNSAVTVLAGVNLVGGAKLTLNQTGGFASFLNFQNGSQTLGGTGEVVFDGSGNQSFLRPVRSGAPTATLTIGSGVIVRTGTGSGTLGGSSQPGSGLIIEGNITAQTAGRSITL